MTLEAQPEATPTTTAPETATPPAADAAATPPAEATPAVPDRLAPRFAELAKREREWTQKQAEWKPKLEAAEKFEAARARIEEDPMVALELLGVPFQRLVDAMLNHGKPLTAEDRIERLEKEREAERKAAEERVEQEKGARAKEVIDGFMTQIGETLQASADTFPLVAAKGATSTVFDVIELHYQKTGELLAIPDAAKMVEDHLREQAKKEYEVYSRIFGQSPTPPAGAPPPSTPAGAVKPPQFSAKDAAVDPAPSAPPPARESREQRLARIARTTQEREAARQTK